MRKDNEKGDVKSDVKGEDRNGRRGVCHTGKGKAGSRQA